MPWRFRLLGILSFLGLMLAGPLAGHAAEPYKVGDSIEVFFLNKWWPAAVVQTNARGDVMAEFEFAATLDPESLMIIKSGTELAVNLQCGEHNERVYAAMQPIANRNGWVLRQNAPLVIVCEDPDKQNGLGVTQVTNRGLIPQE